MSIKTHKDYKEEIQRLSETKTYLENTIATVMENRIKFNEEIRDAYIHLDFLDSSMSYSSIMLNSKLLDELEKNFELLLHARKKTYFARMDIRQKGKEHYEKFYIGKVSLYDQTMEIPLVIDWRAPIASVYYEGRLGASSYDVGTETHDIDLLTKRQYTLEDGELINFMDVDVSTTDTFLQATLEGHAGEKLKDIVSTIQAEQNQIIRAEMDKPLIVQGVAGSGKTTIALHRIAYLIYTFADSFSPESFMIIAPNSLFLDYISSVLPELGANKVQQTTYIDLMFKLIGKKLKLTDSSIKLNELIRNDASALSTHEKQQLSDAAALKHSVEMKSMLDAYIIDIESKILPQNDFYFADLKLLTQTEIHKMFFDTYSYLPFYRRTEHIKKYLMKITRNKVKDVVKDIEEKANLAMERLLDREVPSDERRSKIVQMMHDRDAAMDKYNKASKTAVKKYTDQILSMDLFAFYEDFIKNMAHYANDEKTRMTSSYVHSHFQTNLQNKAYELEDLTALVYLKDKVFGLGDSLEVRMVVIDEAQDFSPFQFIVLRHVLNTERFTILGDLSQGIHMYRSIENWDYIKTNIFKTPTNYLTLEQSYRTTIEIMDTANLVLQHLNAPNMIYAKPVVRHGKKPDFIWLSNEKEVVNAVIEQLNTWQNEGFTTMAVIVKSNQEAEHVYKMLSKSKSDLDMTWVNEKTEHFNHRILIIPAHLAKGLEFDVVIVTTINEHYKKNALDVKLMYVSMTRAMHRLSVIGKMDSIDYVLESAH